MPYGGSFIGMGGMGYGGGYGQPMGIGGGLSAGIDAIMRHRLMQQEADRYAQQMAWMQNPQNPENQLRSAQARETAAMANLAKSKSGEVSVAGLLGMMGKPVPAGMDPNAVVNAAQVAQILSRMGGGNSGIIQRGMASVLRGVMNRSEQIKVDTLPSALALHNKVATIMDAYNSANGDAGLATRLIQQEAAKNPIASAIAQSIGGDPSKLAALLHSTEYNLAGESYKIVNGSSAAPSLEYMNTMMASLPQPGDSRQVAAEKLNNLVDTQIRPAMQGPIGRLESFKDAQGNYPVQLYQTVHDNLVNQLAGFGQQVKGMSDFTSAPNGDINSNLIPPSAGTPKPQGFLSGIKAGLENTFGGQTAPVPVPVPPPSSALGPSTPATAGWDMGGGSQGSGQDAASVQAKMMQDLAAYRASKANPQQAAGAVNAPQP